MSCTIYRCNLWIKITTHSIVMSIVPGRCLYTRAHTGKYIYEGPLDIHESLVDAMRAQLCLWGGMRLWQVLYENQAPLKPCELYSNEVQGFLHKEASMSDYHQKINVLTRMKDWSYQGAGSLLSRTLRGKVNHDLLPNLQLSPLDVHMWMAMLAHVQPLIMLLPWWY